MGTYLFNPPVLHTRCLRHLFYRAFLEWVDFRGRLHLSCVRPSFHPPRYESRTGILFSSSYTGFIEHPHCSWTFIELSPPARGIICSVIIDRSLKLAYIPGILLLSFEVHLHERSGTIGSDREARSQRLRFAEDRNAHTRAPSEKASGHAPLLSSLKVVLVAHRLKYLPPLSSTVIILNPRKTQATVGGSLFGP